jgi:hypothetical protein
MLRILKDPYGTLAVEFTATELLDDLDKVEARFTGVVAKIGEWEAMVAGMGAYKALEIAEGPLEVMRAVRRAVCRAESLRWAAYVGGEGRKTVATFKKIKAILGEDAPQQRGPAVEVAGDGGVATWADMADTEGAAEESQGPAWV